jgi:hypothetical protein
MSKLDKENESPGTTLCKSCGLCCSGHLFAWVKLRSPELVPIEELGVQVFRDPRHRGFSQPCPLWNGVCTIYESPQYPRACRTYKCKLLKQVLEETVTLPEALIAVQNAKELTHEVELLLSSSPNSNFRERLVAHIEQGNADLFFQMKAAKLLAFYRDFFGVKDLTDMAEES